MPRQTRAEKEAQEAKEAAAVPSKRARTQRTGGRLAEAPILVPPSSPCADRLFRSSTARLSLACVVKPPPEPRVKGIHLILPYLFMGSADVGQSASARIGAATPEHATRPARCFHLCARDELAHRGIKRAACLGEECVQGAMQRRRRPTLTPPCFRFVAAACVLSLAVNKDELKYLGIKHIMNCASEDVDNMFPDDFTYTRSGRTAVAV